MARIASVVRPMSLIGRFSIMPSWKDDGHSYLIDTGRVADYTGVGPDFVPMRPRAGYITSDIRLKLACREIRDEGSGVV